MKEFKAELFTLDGRSLGKTIIIPERTLKRATLRLREHVGGIAEFEWKQFKGVDWARTGFVFSKEGKWVVR